VLKNESHLISRSYADEMNNNWESTGTICEIDEDESIERAKQLVKDAKIRLENDEARETASRAVASLALGANKANPLKDTTPEINEELEAARKEYFDLTGEEVHHLKQLKGIRKMIKQYKENN
jgi:predicted Mrr-cat superfamily restriction endonuclease